MGTLDSTTGSSWAWLGGAFLTGSLITMGSGAGAIENADAEWNFDEGYEQAFVKLADSVSNTRTEMTQVEIRFGQAERAPRTSLGRHLLALRQRAISRGMRLLNWDEVNEEVMRRRGELDDGE